MKHIARSSVFRRTAALLLAAVLALPTVYAAAGEQKLQTTSTLTDGLTYRNTVTVNNSSRIESFSLELEPDSQVQPIMIQASGTVYGAATINRALPQMPRGSLGSPSTSFIRTYQPEVEVRVDTVEKSRLST